MLCHVHFAADRFDPLPPLAALRRFGGETPLEIVQAALQAMPPPVEHDGEQFWARVVIETNDGLAKRALSIPLVREGTLPIDFGLPIAGGR